MILSNIFECLILADPGPTLVRRWGSPFIHPHLAKVDPDGTVAHSQSGRSRLRFLRLFMQSTKVIQLRYIGFSSTQQCGQRKTPARLSCRTCDC